MKEFRYMNLQKDVATETLKIAENGLLGTSQIKTITLERLEEIIKNHIYFEIKINERHEIGNTYKIKGFESASHAIMNELEK